MKKQKSNFLAVKLARAAVGALSVLTAMVLLIPVEGAQTAADTAVASLTGSIFANTYVTGGADSVINGDVLAGTYLTNGASAVINGSTLAATVTTLGAGASVTGSLQSGTATVLGEGATVTGSSTLSPVTTISGVQADVQNAQSVLNGLTTTTELPPGDIATNITFNPGVFKVTGLMSVTAGVIITLDAGGDENAEFIFNISNYLTFGANVKVVVTNGGANARVIWNATGGYISIGAGADIVGTVMAHTYVSTGAYSAVSGVSGSDSNGANDFDTCGGAVYSATSYVSVGEGATVGAGDGCTSPPECDTCRLKLNDDGSITIEWCPVVGADAYVVSWSVDESDTSVENVDVGTIFIHEDPPFGTNYYKVYAVHDGVKDPTHSCDCEILKPDWNGTE
jgi:hypothetical protein